MQNRPQFRGPQRRVSYFYNPQISKYTYSAQHPMKPQRMAMAHSLIVNYGIYHQLDVYRGRKAQQQEMQRFHTPEYISYLSNYVSTGIVAKYDEIGLVRALKPGEERRADLAEMRLRQEYKVGDSTDCPAFNGLYDFCQLSAGASIDCARAIMSGKADVAINWGGGLHHAKKCQASGFCYVNDIVLCILEMLEIYSRVLYVDIDVHHGDGVQQAFYLTSRVMTVSFHQYGEQFFPGTGNIDSIGQGQGKHYSLNIPLKKGINDSTYFQLFKTTIESVMSHYRPDVVVVQLGADSLAHDRLGEFNLSIKCHGACLGYVFSFGVPVVMVGGGGYTIENVARCWAFETGVALGVELTEPIPKTDPYYGVYGFEKKMHIPTKNIEDQNSKQDLDRIRKQVSQNLRQLEVAPGVQFHHVPRLASWARMQCENSVEEIDNMID